MPHEPRDASRGAPRGRRMRRLRGLPGARGRRVVRGVAGAMRLVALGVALDGGGVRRSSRALF